MIFRRRIETTRHVNIESLIQTGGLGTFRDTSTSWRRAPLRSARGTTRPPMYLEN